MPQPLGSAAPVPNVLPQRDESSSKLLPILQCKTGKIYCRQLWSNAHTDKILFWSPTPFQVFWGWTVHSPGRWSSCILDDEDRTGTNSDRCGMGLHYRTVYCLSALDENLSDSNCSHLGQKPVMEEKCKVPCKEDCTVSSWSAWSSCSASCGLQGKQTRYRRITSEPNSYSTRCSFILFIYLRYYHHRNR